MQTIEVRVGKDHAGQTSRSHRIDVSNERDHTVGLVGAGNRCRVGNNLIFVQTDTLQVDLRRRAGRNSVIEQKRDVQQRARLRVNRLGLEYPDSDCPVGVVDVRHDLRTGGRPNAASGDIGVVGVQQGGVVGQRYFCSAQSRSHADVDGDSELSCRQNHELIRDLDTHRRDVFGLGRCAEQVAGFQHFICQTSGRSGHGETSVIIA